ncbi:MAG: serine/threonine-protein kinase, partial [Arthrobacter sp.]|uniref:serine/threonine-protein kinase n=1 Tax=Arthrobacter sp. TaxID=1667 RepID=UPI00347E853F
MEESPETPASGTAPTADGWILLREIGRGGASAVHEALDEATGERLALKIALDAGPGGTPSADAVAREVDVLRGIVHPHLVPVFGTAPTSAGPGILMEYLPGGSAADLVAARGPVGLGEAVTILAPVARALAHLHGAGAVHGDVSPANILFTATGLPKLGDLGLAGLVGRHGPTGGTPGFSAPEAVDARDRRLRPERDVFALAAVAWYLLTGRVPAATSHRPPLGSLVPAAPDEFALLLERCLSEDPDQRPAAAEFAREVFRAAPPEPVSLTASVHPAALGHMVTVVGQEPGRPRRRLRSASGLRKARQGIAARRGGTAPRAAAFVAGVAVLGVVGAAAAVLVPGQGPAGPAGPVGEGLRPT